MSSILSENEWQKVVSGIKWYNEWCIDWQQMTTSCIVSQKEW